MYETDPPTLITRLHYPNPTRSVVVGPHFAFASTDSGLESWTVRRAGRTASGALVMPPEPLLVSLKRFVGLRAVLALERHVVLLNRPSESDSAREQSSKRRERSLSATSNSPPVSGTIDVPDWALYELALESHEVIADEQLIEAASRYAGVDEALQGRLLDEACSLLRVRLAAVLRTDDGGAREPEDGGSSVRSLQSHVTASALRQRLRRARRRLAEHLTSTGELLDAARLWAVSDASVARAFKALGGSGADGNAAQSPMSAERAKGLTRYLRHVLFDSTFLRERRLLGSVSNDDDDDDDDNVDDKDSDSAQQQRKALGNAILQHFARYEAETLALVLLESWLTDYDASFALSLVQRTNERMAGAQAVADARSEVQRATQRSPALLAHMRRFALAVLLAASAQEDGAAVDEARDILATLPARAVFDLLSANTKLLLSDIELHCAGEKPSRTIGALVLRAKPWTFCEVAHTLLRAARDTNTASELSDAFYAMLADGNQTDALIRQARIVEAQIIATRETGGPLDSLCVDRLAHTYGALMHALDDAAPGSSESAVANGAKKNDKAQADDDWSEFAAEREFWRVAVAPVPKWIAAWPTARENALARKVAALLCALRDDDKCHARAAQAMLGAAPQPPPAWLRLVCGDVDEATLALAVQELPHDALRAYASAVCVQKRHWTLLLAALGREPAQRAVLQSVLLKLRAQLSSAQLLAILPQDGEAALYLPMATTIRVD